MSDKKCSTCKFFNIFISSGDIILGKCACHKSEHYNQETKGSFCCDLWNDSSDKYPPGPTYPNERNKLLRGSRKYK